MNVWIAATRFVQSDYGVCGEDADRDVLCYVCFTIARGRRPDFVNCEVILMVAEALWRGGVVKGVRDNCEGEEGDVVFLG